MFTQHITETVEETVGHIRMRCVQRERDHHLARHLLVNPHLGQVQAVGLDGKPHDDEENAYETYDDIALRVDSLEIGGKHSMQHIHIVAHAAQFLILHEQQFGIGAVHYGRMQHVHPLIFPALHYIHCQLEKFQAMGGIDIGGFEDAFLYQFYASAR